MKYALITEHVGQFSVTLMCAALNVSRSGYYRWLNREPSPREMRRSMLTEKVVDLYATYKARYGAPRIRQELNALDIPCSKNLIANRKWGQSAI